MTNIAVLPTYYNGILYRSRTEARWAVFFSALDVSFVYESETYRLNDKLYLPDFWIPSWRIYIEVKGTESTLKEQELCALLCSHTDRMVLLVEGPPGLKPGKLWNNDVWDGVSVEFFCCRRCNGYALSHEDVGYTLLGDHADRCGDRWPCDQPVEAFQRARNERFGVYPNISHIS